MTGKHDTSNFDHDSNESIPDERLMEAADAILGCVRRMLEDGAQDVPYPPDVMGTTEQPSEFVEFTREEIEEGTQFLIRLGFFRAVEEDERATEG